MVINEYFNGIEGRKRHFQNSSFCCFNSKGFGVASTDKQTEFLGFSGEFMDVLVTGHFTDLHGETEGAFRASSRMVARKRFTRSISAADGTYT
jgi:hypothetical protein